MSYEMICGIETHVELATDTKIFCACTTAFGGAPNTHCCPVCTGQPGALPTLNREVVTLAVKAGLALHCEIRTVCHMDRKNYYYPDLPKAYQISQFDEPVCENGYVTLDSGKRIRIERIHIEEDAGKLIHDGANTYIDYNRCGVPLIEIVSHADIRTPEEAMEYAGKLRQIMRAVGVSDCKMQEGSMRCDVNVSLHAAGEPWGTRTEIKNINSITNIGKAIVLEVARQEKLLSDGGTVRQSTMRYDEDQNEVYVLRTKEGLDDYRFFPEPDLPAFTIEQAQVEALRESLPELPDDRRRRYLTAYQLPDNKVRLIYPYARASAFFDAAVARGASPSGTLNMILSTVYATLATEEDKENFAVRITPQQLAALVTLVDAGKLLASRGKEVLAQMLVSGEDVSAFVSEEELTGLEENDLADLCRAAVAANPKAVADLRGGKAKAMNVLVGCVMRESRGRADVKQTQELLRQLTEK